MLFRRFEKRWRERKTYEDVDAMLDVFAWMAAYGPLTRKSNGQIVHLKRGEVLLSSRFCAKRWKCSASTATRWIQKWREEGFLTVVRSEGQAGTVYALPNYPPLNVLAVPEGGDRVHESVGDPPAEPPSETPVIRRKAKRQKASSNKSQPRPEPPSESQDESKDGTNKKKIQEKISIKESAGGGVDEEDTSPGSEDTHRYPTDSEEFKDFLRRFPPRNSAPDPVATFKAWYDLVASGHVTPTELIEAARYYYEEQRKAGKLETQWVQAPHTFLKKGAWKGMLEAGRRQPQRSAYDPYEAALQALRRHEDRR